MFKRWRRPAEPPRSQGKAQVPHDPVAQGPLAGGEAGGEPALAGSAQAEPSARGGPHAPRRRCSAQERERLLAEFALSDKTPEEFAALHGIRPSTLVTWLRRARQRTKRAAGGKGRRFTPEERRAAVEAFLKAGRSRADFARMWGCSTSTLDKWLRRYESEGPKGLETRRREQPSRPRPHNRYPDAVRAEIVAVREAHPDFGMNRIADQLARFRGLKISPSTVRNVLIESGIPLQPVPRKRPRRGPIQPRRFERARPGELWQTDITSYVLRRHGRRVYFTVYLDDHSRFIVSWALATHQRTPLVTEPLLEGIARFGKPREVLSDQGRQYYAWRGKSGFQKLLAREGIEHVVSRAHHPQTLGKCERLWKTVAEEFWDRARPEDLDDARRRIGHWIAHYNFFRPHQGIDGLVPADRFFGAASTLRESLERELSGNELRLALGEAPRQPVYLVGQIGEERIALHGERGRLVIQSPQSGRREMELKHLGVEARDALEESGAGSHGRNARESERNSRFGADGGTEAAASRSQADGLQGAAETRLAGAGSVGGGAGGGEAPGARGMRGDLGVLAGQEDQGRGGERAQPHPAAGLADEPDGAVGDDGGAVASAPSAREPRGLRAQARGVPGVAEAAHPAAGEGAVADRGPGAGAENSPVGEREYGLDSDRRNESWSQGRKEAGWTAAPDEERRSRSGSGSGRCSGRGTSLGRLWRNWLRGSE